MKKICFIAQFPPPMHGLSKAVETLYNSNLNFEIDSQGEFEFEKVDITNNKNFIKNLLKISRSKGKWDGRVRYISWNCGWRTEERTSKKMLHFCIAD